VRLTLVSCDLSTACARVLRTHACLTRATAVYYGQASRARADQSAYREPVRASEPKEQQGVINISHCSAQAAVFDSRRHSSLADTHQKLARSCRAQERRCCGDWQAFDPAAGRLSAREEPHSYIDRSSVFVQSISEIQAVVIAATHTSMSLWAATHEVQTTPLYERGTIHDATSDGGSDAAALDAAPHAPPQTSADYLHLIS
jgi:hypothetical protein